MTIASIQNDAKSTMEKAISHLELELTKVRAGKVNPSLLDNIYVDAYGSKMPLSQVANISTPDARTLVIQPWDKSMLKPCEQELAAANLGANPQNDGNVIKLFMPPLTEERRREFVKKAKEMAENAKVSIRTIRRDSNEAVKKLKAEVADEDGKKASEKHIQDLTDKYTAMIDKHLEGKEKEIMTV